MEHPDQRGVFPRVERGGSVFAQYNFEPADCIIWTAVVGGPTVFDPDKRWQRHRETRGE